MSNAQKWELKDSLRKITDKYNDSVDVINKNTQDLQNLTNKVNTETQDITEKINNEINNITANMEDTISNKVESKLSDLGVENGTVAKAGVATKAISDNLGNPLSKTLVNLRVENAEISAMHSDGTETKVVVNNVKKSLSSENDSVGQKIDATYIKSIRSENDKIVQVKGNGEETIVADLTTSKKSNSDALGQKIDATYIKDVTIGDGTITLHKGDGTTTSLPFNNYNISFCKKRYIKKSAGTAQITWQDPDPLTTGWAKTILVRKKNSYPENVKDGTIVVESTEYNKYLNTPFEDTISDVNKMYYCLFPVGKDGKTYVGDYNKVGFYHYGIWIDREDGNEATCIHAVEGYENEGYSPIKVNFTSNVDNNTTSMGDWDNAPFMPRPCALRHNGTVDYYLDPNNYNKREDGTNNENVNNVSYDGEMMMEWPSIFTHQYSTATRHYLFFCSEKLTEDYECYPTLKADGTYTDHFYTAIYEGRVVNSVMRSLSSGTNGNNAGSAVPTSSTTAQNEVMYARVNGTGWSITRWADEDLIRKLGVLVLGRLNSSRAIGYNCGSSNQSLTHPNGRSNEKGMFFGHYTTSKYSTKFFGMENWWGHRWRRLEGCILKDYKYLVKMTKHSGDGSTVEDFNYTGEGYINLGESCGSTSHEYITDVIANKRGFTLPSKTTKLTADGNISGTATTYYCDIFVRNSGTRYAFVGGAVANGSHCGLFCSSLYHEPSDAYWYVGASLSYHKEGV